MPRYGVHLSLTSHRLFAPANSPIRSRRCFDPKRRSCAPLWDRPGAMNFLPRASSTLAVAIMGAILLLLPGRPRPTRQRPGVELLSRPQAPCVDNRDGVSGSCSPPADGFVLAATCALCCSWKERALRGPPSPGPPRGRVPRRRPRRRSARSAAPYANNPVPCANCCERYPRYLAGASGKSRSRPPSTSLELGGSRS